MANNGIEINLDKSWTFDGFIPEEFRNYGDNLEQESKYKIFDKGLRRFSWNQFSLIHQI